MNSGDEARSTRQRLVLAKSVPNRDYASPEEAMIGSLRGRSLDDYWYDLGMAKNARVVSTCTWDSVARLNLERGGSLDLTSTAAHAAPVPTLDSRPPPLNGSRTIGTRATARWKRVGAPAPGQPGVSAEWTWFREASMERVVGLELTGVLAEPERTLLYFDDQSCVLDFLSTATVPDSSSVLYWSWLEWHGDVGPSGDPSRWSP
jgi:hypothetical protein